MRGSRAKELRRRSGHGTEKRRYIELGNCGYRLGIRHNVDGTVMNHPESPRAIYRECKKLYMQGVFVPA